MKVPPEFAQLVATGVLKPEDQEPPVMKCAKCGLPVTLVRTRKVANSPGVWGKDVAVVCPCCSYAGCPHRRG